MYTRMYAIRSFASHVYTRASIYALILTCQTKKLSSDPFNLILFLLNYMSSNHN